ncbi:hypothetical protein D043_1407A, partial [Vibrio parahaemolyticus EKP-021]
MIGVFMAL